MPQKTRTPKTVIWATRVTPRIRDLVQMIVREELNVSKWLRNIIIMELKNFETQKKCIKGAYI